MKNILRGLSILIIVIPVLWYLIALNTYIWVEIIKLPIYHLRGAVSLLLTILTVLVIAFILHIAENIGKQISKHF